MKVSVIICTYNREAYILDSLTGIQDQTFAKDLYEVIIVDNNSTDSTPLLCMDFIQHKGNMHIQYIKEINQGLSYARNTGIANAKGNIIVFLDDDAVPCKQYIESINNFFETTISAMALGGRIFPKYEMSCPSWIPEQLTPLFSIINLGESDMKFSRNKYPIGANMAFRKQVFSECGLFNVNLGRTGKNLLGGEEKDIFAKMTARNMEIWYSPNPWVYHIIPPSRTTKEFILKQAIGVGQSEFYRAKVSVITYVISLIKESIKWVGTCILGIYNILVFQPQRAFMLIRFRWNVSMGLINVYKV